MTEDQKLQEENYYKELIEKGTINTLNECLVFKLAYEKALDTISPNKNLFKVGFKYFDRTDCSIHHDIVESYNNLNFNKVFNKYGYDIEIVTIEQIK